MKALRRHIVACKDNGCKYPKCLTSRHILGHYRRCKCESCPICIPVRKTVRQWRDNLVMIW
eukprot:9323628-Ditylum_brightwellii.AAC.1